MRLSCEIADRESFDICRTDWGYINWERCLSDCALERLKVLIVELVSQFILIDTVDKERKTYETHEESGIELLISQTCARIVE